MKVLILTPINPVTSAELYHYFTEIYRDKNVGILCFPFFAEMRAQIHGSEYVPTYFAMIKSSLEPDLNAKLYDKKNMIVIGNVYQDEHFDLIVALENDPEKEYFDGYLELIKSEPDLDLFKNKIYIDSLYTLNHADIVLPTKEHIKLFLEGVFK